MSKLERCNILIVETDPAIRATISTYIKQKRANWHVLEAENSYQAMELAEQYPLNFFIIDEYLPSLSGVNLIIELKRAHTPGKFILLTLQLSDHLKTEIEIMGVKHLSKPITQETMSIMLKYFQSSAKH